MSGAPAAPHRGRRRKPPTGIILLLAVAGLLGCAGPASAPSPPAEPPDLSTKTVQPTEYFVYQVRPGDTLISLQARFQVPWEVIAEDNEVEDPTSLRVGELLYVRHVPGVKVPALPEPAHEASPEPVRPSAPRRVSDSDLHRGHPSSTFWWPTTGTLLRRYGDVLRGLPEAGIAVGAPPGTEVCAAASGRVIAVIGGRPGGDGWGNVVAAAHSGDRVSWYGHLGRILVEKGDRVGKGEPIGTVGTSGAADRPQVAFRLFRKERFVNPLDYLP